MSSYAAVVLADGPIAFIQLHELSGTAAADSANSNNGVYNGSPPLGVAGAPSGIGTAVNFNGALTYAQIPDASALRLGTSLSFEAWTNPGASYNTNFALLLMKATGASPNFSTSDYLWQITPTGALELFIRPTTGADSTTAVPLSAWSHLVTTYDGANVKHYINGVISNTVTLTTVPTVSAGALIIGNQPGHNGSLAGPMSSLAVYNKVLTPTQIATHYTARTAPFATQALPTDPNQIQYFISKGGILVPSMRGKVAGTADMNYWMRKGSIMFPAAIQKQLTPTYQPLTMVI